jgi:hypothetical protein
MAWETKVNRELRHLNDAHSTARMETAEYRRRRRALLQSVLLSEGSASHTLRRPAGGAAVAFSASAFSVTTTGATTMRATPTRRAAPRAAPKRWKQHLLWCLVGGVLVLLAAALMTWLLLR